MGAEGRPGARAPAVMHWAAAAVVVVVIVIGLLLTAPRQAPAGCREIVVLYRDAGRMVYQSQPTPCEQWR